MRRKIVESVGIAAAVAVAAGAWLGKKVSDAIDEAVRYPKR